MAKGIRVASTERAVFVRVVGRGNYLNSQPVRRYLLEMLASGHRAFVVDLSQCQGLDSTFLGVLSGIGLQLFQSGAPGQVQIVNASSHSLESLRILRLDCLLQIVAPLDATLPPPPADAQFQFLPGTDRPPAGGPLDPSITQLMLKAHSDLVRVDKANEPKFRDVIRLLREDIARRRPTESKPE